MKSLIIKQDTALVLKKSKSTLSITKKILSGKKSLITETIEDWMKSLWDWADENKIDETISYFYKYDEIHLEFGGNIYFFHCIDIEELRSEFRKDLEELKEYYSFANGNLQSNYDKTNFSFLYYLKTGISKNKHTLINTIVLDLSSKDICIVPDEIYLLTKLEALGLADNNLGTLSPDISKLDQLLTLDLRSNKLKSLPDEICTLVNLKNLFLNDNTKLILTDAQKDWIENLENNGCYIEVDKYIEDWIKEIWIWADRNDIDNNIIPRRKDLLLALDTIDLSGQELDSITSKLCFLEYVSTLILADNIKELPKEIVNFKNLKILNLKNNPLVLTNIQKIWIEQLKEKGCEVYLNLDVIEYSKNNVLINDSWMERLWAWADENNVSDLEWVTSDSMKNGGYWKGLPRDKEKLLSLTVLNLKGNELTKLPKEIGNLVNLTHLGLSENQLIELPKEISTLVNLIVLTLINNQLTELPKEIENLVNLKYLMLDNNQSIELPKEIENLTNLTWLDLSGNNLTQLPKEIGNLVNLGHLSLSKNQLTELPKEIGNLMDLKFLNIEDNNLTELPKEIINLSPGIIMSYDKNVITLTPEQKKWQSDLVDIFG